MKKWVMLLVFCLLAGLLYGGGETETGEINYLVLDWEKIIEEAKKEATLTFYTFHDEQLWKELAADFKARYEIEVTVVTDSKDALLAKILAEKDEAQGTLDAVLIGDGMAKESLEAQTYYGPLLDILPDGDRLDPELSQYQDGAYTNGNLVPLYRTQSGFAYDSQKLSSVPQTWDELVDWVEQNPRQLAFCDPAKGESGQAFVQMVIVYLSGGLEKYRGDESLDAEKVAYWDQAWKWLSKVKDKSTVTTSDTDTIDKLNEGAVTLAAARERDIRLGLQKGSISNRIKFSVPKMGFPGSGATVGVLKNAPHKGAAMLFCAFLIEQATQRKIANALGYAMARTDASPDTPLLEEKTRQRHGIAWLPDPYLDYMQAEFAKQVAAD